MFVEFIILSIVALVAFYLWSVNNYDFFEKRGIPYHKPFPLFGSMKDMVFRRKSMYDVIADLYNMHNGKIYGVFDQRTPAYLIRDPDLIKQITIKDFDHFVNHRSVFSKSDNTNLFSSSLLAMQDAEWKDMRSTLSPAFTGSKMRQMFQLINIVVENTVKYLKDSPGINTKEGYEMDMKDFCTRFTNDVIASTAFGLQVNSFQNKDNEFYAMGKKVTTLTVWQNIKFILFFNFKFIMKILKLQLFDKQQTQYFMDLVLGSMKYRKEHDIIRPDMINLLMEARGMIKSDNPKQHNREWTDVDIVAQCFLFFFAGFEPSSVLMCFAAHELMENPETQKRLFEEIEEITNELNGAPLTYEKLQNMKYMDMVVSEVLRKWPNPVLDRECNKDFEYEADGERIEIKKGAYIWIPVVGIHRDPQYYKDPLKFDPERFNEENKNKIVPCTYFPFGLGPRNCIGSRLALIEAKALIFYLVRGFRLEAGKKTTIPIKLDAKSFQIIPKNGFWLKLCSRT